MQKCLVIFRIVALCILVPVLGRMFQRMASGAEFGLFHLVVIAFALLVVFDIMKFFLELWVGDK